MVLSAGLRILGALSSFFFDLSTSGSVYCREVYTIWLKNDESCRIFQCTAYCSFTHPVLLNGPFGSQIVPDTPSIMPTTLVFPPCVVVRVTFRPRCLRGLPPCRASPSEHLLLCIDHHIRSFITDPSHSSPRAFGDHFRRNGNSIF